MKAIHLLQIIAVVLAINTHQARAEDLAATGSLDVVCMATPPAATGDLNVVEASDGEACRVCRCQFPGECGSAECAACREGCFESPNPAPVPSGYVLVGRKARSCASCPGGVCETNAVVRETQTVERGTREATSETNAVCEGPACQRQTVTTTTSCETSFESHGKPMTRRQAKKAAKRAMKGGRCCS